MIIPKRNNNNNSLKLLYVTKHNEATHITMRHAKKNQHFKLLYAARKKQEQDTSRHILMHIVSHLCLSQVPMDSTLDDGKSCEKVKDVPATEDWFARGGC